MKKGVGKVSDVNYKIQLDSLQGNIGIGHTRWATHGGVNQNNAHPYLSADGSIALVHWNHWKLSGFKKATRSQGNNILEQDGHR